MSDKKKKINWREVRLVVTTVALCAAVAGVVILVQSVDKNAEKRGQLEGYTKAASTIQSLCK